jgi:hypothetical protein
MMRLAGSSWAQPIQYQKVRLVENTCPNRPARPAHAHPASARAPSGRARGQRSGVPWPQRRSARRPRGKNPPGRGGTRRQSHHGRRRRRPKGRRGRPPARHGPLHRRPCPAPRSTSRPPHPSRPPANLLPRYGVGMAGQEPGQPGRPGSQSLALPPPPPGFEWTGRAGGERRGSVSQARDGSPRIGTHGKGAASSYWATVASHPAS